MEVNCGAAPMSIAGSGVSGHEAGLEAAEEEDELEDDEGRKKCLRAGCFLLVCKSVLPDTAAARCERRLRFNPR